MNYLNKIIDYDKTLIIKYLILLYAFIIPLSHKGIVNIGVILFVLWLLDRDIKNKFFSLFQNKLLLAFALFLTYSLVSLLWSDNIYDGIVIYRRYWFLLAIIPLSTNIKKDDIRLIISAFLAGMFVSEIISYGIFFELWHFGRGTPIDPTPVMHHVFYSTFLAFTSLLILNRFFFEQVTKIKLFYIFYFISVTANLFINGGRTGYVAFLISIFIVALLNIKNKLLALISVSIVISGIFFTAYNTSSVFQARLQKAIVESNKFETNSQNKYNDSIGLRLGIWQEGLKVFIKNPIFGTGMGDEIDEVRKVIKADQKKFLPLLNMYHFHSNYIQFSAELGIIGLILYLNIFYQLFRLKIDDKELSNLRYIFIVIFCVASMFDFIFHGKFSLALLALFSSIFINSNKNNTI